MLLFRNWEVGGTSALTLPTHAQCLQYVCVVVEAYVQVFAFLPRSSQDQNTMPQTFHTRKFLHPAVRNFGTWKYECANFSQLCTVFPICTRMVVNEYTSFRFPTSKFPSSKHDATRISYKNIPKIQQSRNWELGGTSVPTLPTHV